MEGEQLCLASYSHFAAFGTQAIDHSHQDGAVFLNRVGRELWGPLYSKNFQFTFSIRSVHCRFYEVGKFYPLSFKNSSALRMSLAWSMSSTFEKRKAFSRKPSRSKAR